MLATLKVDKVSSRSQRLFMRLFLLLFGCSTSHAASTRQQFDKEGFVILRGLLEPKEADGAHQDVMNYLRRNGSAHAKTLMGERYGGWVIGGFPGLQDAGFTEAESIVG